MCSDEDVLVVAAAALAVIINNRTGNMTGDCGSNVAFPEGLN